MLLGYSGVMSLTLEYRSLCIIHLREGRGINLRDILFLADNAGDMHIIPCSCVHQYQRDELSIVTALVVHKLHVPPPSIGPMDNYSQQKLIFNIFDINMA